MYTGAATVENSMEIPQNIKNRTTIESINSTPGYLSEENENTMIRNFSAPLFLLQHHF